MILLFMVPLSKKIKCQKGQNYFEVDLAQIKIYFFFFFSKNLQMKTKILRNNPVFLTRFKTLSRNA